MKALKIFGKILPAILLLVLVLMFTVPYFYKEKIKTLAKEEINKQLNAEVNFADADLSFFRNFPNISLGIYDITVVKKPADTLLKVEGLYVTAGLFGMLKEDVIEVNSIEIKKPSVALRIDEKGKTNWDILKQSDAKETKSEEGQEEVSLLLKKILIEDAEINYTDETSDLTFSAGGMDVLLRGRFTESRTDLAVKLYSEDVTVAYEGVRYLNGTAVAFDAVVDANLEDEIYNLKDNSLYLNGLKLNFEGSVAFVNDDLNLMLVYSAPDNSFKQLLSLVPLVYKDSFDKLSTTGDFSLEGYVKGMYSETKLPDFKLQMHTANTEISYEGMAASVKNIGFDLLIENKGNDPDNTLIKLDNFSAVLHNDHVNLNVFMTKLISDPFIDLKASGAFHLENLKDVFPQESLQSLAGELIADLSIKGKLSSAEQNDYKNFLAMGSLIANNVKYDYGEGEYPIELHHAQFNFSPSKIDVIGFDSRINNNKIVAEGQLENYLAYYLKDDLFKGNLKVSSDILDINELLEPWSTDESSEANGGDSAAEEDEVTYIPTNLDVVVTLSADTVFYKTMVFSDFRSKVHIYEGRLDFEELNSDFLGGLINLDGFYEAAPGTTPHLNCNLSLKDMEIGNAYQNLSPLRQFAPIAEKARGIFNASLSFSADFDEQMNFVWTSMLGNGNFASENIHFSSQDIFNKIAGVLKVNLFDNLSTGPVDLKFNMLDGKLYTSPFTLKVDQVQMEVGGWTGADREINYTIGFTIPVDMLGGDVGKVMNQYASELSKFGIETGDVTTLKPVVSVTGNYNDPKVKLISMGKPEGGGAKEIIEDKVEEVVNEYAEKANAEAEKILAEARQRADSILSTAQAHADKVMQQARQSVKNAKAEARKQADQMVKEAAKEGPVAELAAKAAAKELIRNADQQAEKVLQKAQQQADQIVDAARNQSERIMKEANEKADRIRQ